MQESTLPLRIDQGAIQDADELALFFLEEDIHFAMKFLEELEDAYENIRRLREHTTLSSPLPSLP